MFSLIYTYIIHKTPSTAQELNQRIIIYEGDGPRLSDRTKGLKDSLSELFTLPWCGWNWRLSGLVPNSRRLWPQTVAYKKTLLSNRGHRIGKSYRNESRALSLCAKSKIISSVFERECAYAAEIFLKVGASLQPFS